jgi:hypothetical protein
MKIRIRDEEEKEEIFEVWLERDGKNVDIMGTLSGSNNTIYIASIEPGVNLHVNTQLEEDMGFTCNRRKREDGGETHD